MSIRPGPSQEGFPSSPPSFETHSNEHFNLAKRYYDTESDHVEYVPRREYRETYNSDNSNPVNDYDNNGNFEYRQYFLSSSSAWSFR
jgi:1,3-beta-glucan synthase